MRPYSMAIIGAGISGLTLALQLQKMNNLTINIFEKEKINGGRIQSHLVSAETYADLGANYFDFQNVKQQQLIRKFMDRMGKEQYSNHLKQFKGPFLIFDKQQLSESDIYKPRYYYENGFWSFLNDIGQNINEHCCIINNYEVARIKKIGGKWKIIDTQDNQYSNAYDFIVLGCSGVDSSSILRNSKVQELFSLYQLINLTKYTKQISAAFELKEKAPFSSILFKNHSISFISSHQQKYKANDQSVAVIQLSETFSEFLSEKDQKDIGQLIKQQIPKQLQDYIGECFTIKVWYPSLIKNRNSGVIDSFQRIQSGIFVTGDVVYGSSRVTGAMEVSLRLSELFKESLNLSL